MYKQRTDLALEARELYLESAAEQTVLSGVKAYENEKEGYPVNVVEILDNNGAQTLGKEIGIYITITLEGFKEHREDAFNRAVRLLASELQRLLNLRDNDSVLIAALGNAAITPDAIGPKAAENLMVTHHLVHNSPETFSAFRPVSVIVPGVLGTTGLESMDIIRAVSDKINPSAIIAIDALASRNLNRVCRTLQLTDTGITPGSGVGNARSALNNNTMGIPVVAIGVPTVVDAATLCMDIVERSGYHNIEEEKLRANTEHMIVTPRDIDNDIKDLSKLIGYGINLALHSDISIEDITMFLS